MSFVSFHSHYSLLLLLCSMRYCRSDRRDPAGRRADDAPMGRFRWLRFDMSVLSPSLLYTISHLPFLFLYVMSRFSAFILLPSALKHDGDNLLFLLLFGFSFKKFYSEKVGSWYYTRVWSLKERKLSVIIYIFLLFLFVYFHQGEMVWRCNFYLFFVDWPDIDRPATSYNGNKWRKSLGRVLLGLVGWQDQCQQQRTPSCRWIMIDLG